MRIFAKLKGVVGTRKTGFEIAQHGIYPPELRQLPGLTATGDEDIMRPPSIPNSIETTQAIGQYMAFSIQGTARPVLNGFPGKPGNRDEFGMDGMPLIVYGNGSGKRHLVFRSAPGLATWVLAAQKIGIIRLGRALQGIQGFALQHRLHELVLDTPSGRIADAQMAFQRQCGQTGLGLGDQINSKKPEGQGQTDTLEKGAENQGGLVTTVKRLARTISQNGMLGSVALGQ